MSRHQHRYPWSSLATPPYRPLLPAGLQDYLPYRHRAAVCRFELVVLPLLVHMKGSTDAHPLWSRPYFSSSVLVRLILIVFLMGGWWPYSCCFVGCCFQDSFNIVRSILVLLLSSFFSIALLSVHVVHPHSSIETTAAWKKLPFIFSVRSDFQMTDSILIAVHAFASCVMMSVSVDETLLPR